MRINVAWLALGSLVAVTAGCAGEAESADEPTQEAHASRVQIALTKAAENGHILYTLRNDSAQPVHVLSWELPNGSARPFAVTRDGESVLFTGWRGTRLSAPGEADYIELAPGEEIAEEVDLVSQFDLAAGGHIEVTNNVFAEVLVAEHEQVEVDVTGTVALDVAPTANKELAVRQDAVISSDNTCNFGQILFTAAAESFAREKSRETWYAIQNGKWKNLAFGIWFGDPGAFQRIQSDAKVKQILTDTEILLSGGKDYAITCQNDASCPGFAARAQQLPNGKPLVRLCPGFFNLAMYGADGAGAAYLHEMTHHGGAWGPETYGAPAAKALAKNNPRAARQNASNYQYYYQNLQ